MRTFFLLDIDCFFASVEMALHPELRGRPLCIGGARGDRGIVSCPNYEARKYGVRTAMPLRTAARLLGPDAVFMPGNYHQYDQYAEKVMAILRDFTPDVEQVSVDEAYMDVTGCLHFWGHDPQRMAQAMKDQIQRECALSVSIGIAANKVCAKIAAGLNKPDGLLMVPPGEEKAFLVPLPVELIPGIGVKTFPKLHACGIRTAGEAMAYAERMSSTPEALPTTRGSGQSPVLSLCRYIASCAVRCEKAAVFHPHVEKSISRDRTFSRDTSDPEHIRATLYCLTERCCKTLRQDALTASTVSVRVRFTNFTTVQKQAVLRAASSNEEDIFGTAVRLLAQLLAPGILIRLVGVKVSNLRGTAQLSLGVIPEEKFNALHRRLDGLQSRYGYATIRWGITCGIAGRREEHP
ncbi:MAG TPA: DNA polymerase IV [Bacteroidota bacterium]|nr:DNA polymerase IV [Bacteroidota bacterium]